MAEYGDLFSFFQHFLILIIVKLRQLFSTGFNSIRRYSTTVLDGIQRYSTTVLHGIRQYSTVFNGIQSFQCIFCRKSFLLKSFLSVLNCFLTFGFHIFLASPDMSSTKLFKALGSLAANNSS